MQKHILLEKTFTYNEDIGDEVVEISKYDIKKGYWVLKDTNKPLMLSNRAIESMSKKADRETGEDQKGE